MRKTAHKREVRRLRVTSGPLFLNYDRAIEECVVNQQTKPAQLCVDLHEEAAVSEEDPEDASEHKVCHIEDVLSFIVLLHYIYYICNSNCCAVDSSQVNTTPYYSSYYRCSSATITDAPFTILGIFDSRLKKKKRRIRKNRKKRRGRPSILRRRSEQRFVRRLALQLVQELDCASSHDPISGVASACKSTRRTVQGDFGNAVLFIVYW